MHIDWNPDSTKLRQFGYFGGFFLIAVLCVSSWLNPQILESGSLSFATCVIGASGLLLVLGAIAPKWLKPIFIGMSVVTFPIGFVVNFLILGLLFYGIFSPLALIFRLIGRDTMERRLDQEAATYWKSNRRQRSPESYYQPF